MPLIKHHVNLDLVIFLQTPQPRCTALTQKHLLTHHNDCAIIANFTLFDFTTVGSR